MLVLAILLLSVPLGGEEIRGLRTKVWDGRDGGPIPLFLEEVLVITIPPEERELYAGLELRITVPRKLQGVQGIAGILYRGILPAPSPERRVYQGTRTFFQILPTSTEVVIQVPFPSSDFVPGGPGVFPTPAVAPDDFPLALVLTPVMKGLPSSASSQAFECTVLPLYARKGYLRLRIEGLDDEEIPACAFFIDGKEISYTGDPILLSSGLHSLTIKGPAFSPLEKTFAVEKGKTTELVVEVERAHPSLLFHVPEVAEIFLDGEKIDAAPRELLPITTGTHSVVIKVGDYSITREFEVTENVTYTITLLLDLHIEEPAH